MLKGSLLNSQWSNLAKNELIRIIMYVLKHSCLKSNREKMVDF